MGRWLCQLCMCLSRALIELPLHPKNGQRKRRLPPGPDAPGWIRDFSYIMFRFLQVILLYMFILYLSCYCLIIEKNCNVSFCLFKLNISFPFLHHWHWVGLCLFVCGTFLYFTGVVSLMRFLHVSYHVLQPMDMYQIITYHNTT